MGGSSATGASGDVKLHSSDGGATGHSGNLLIGTGSAIPFTVFADRSRRVRRLVVVLCHWPSVPAAPAQAVTRQ